MGSIGNTAREGAFQNQIFPKGLDMRRSKYTDDLGTYVALDSATIRQGQWVTYDANEFIVPSAGTGTIGMAKHSKEDLGFSVNVDEVIVLNGTTAANLKRPNVSNVSVRSAANFSVLPYTVATDYTVNATNGTVTRVALGAIADGQTVYVTYTYALTAADSQFDGTTFRNQTNNRVLGQENRIAVITNWSKMYSMEYDSSKAFGMTSNFKLYVDANGRATSTSGTDFIGRVSQLPTSDDQWMGMMLTGVPAA